MIKKEEVFVNESHWRNMDDQELVSFREKIFHYYRETGFPYYPTDMESRKKDFLTLLNYDHSKIIDGDIIKQTMHGLGLAWSYFPHAFDVPCNDKMTPLQAFNDDDIFRKVIDKRLKIGTYMSDSGIRKMLKMYTGVQAVSNFRPTAAAAIYDRYAPNGYVWDMSGGWGGRLLGAITSSVKMYVATEPSSKSISGLKTMVDHFGFFGKRFDLMMAGSERYIPLPEFYDLCFTSPPYFDLEKYADEDSQSYKKYNNRELWVEGFLKKTFENCYMGLKPNGHMIINIADPKKKTNISLEQATLDKAAEVGFTYVETLKLALSSPNMRNRESAFKYEPVFVFKK